MTLSRSITPVRRICQVRFHSGASDGCLLGSRRGIPCGGYARLVEAPNCAPSLCSVAGLLLALALQSRLRGHLASPTQIHNCARATNSPRLTDGARATSYATASVRHPPPSTLSSRDDTPSQLGHGRLAAPGIPKCCWNRAKMAPARPICGHPATQVCDLAFQVCNICTNPLTSGLGGNILFGVRIGSSRA